MCWPKWRPITPRTRFWSATATAAWRPRQSRIASRTKWIRWSNWTRTCGAMTLGGVMRTKSMITTMLPVRDADRASSFYADALGLHPRETGPDGTRYFEAGHGDAIGLRPLPDAQPSENTALSFEVSDIDRAVSESEGRGVR